VRDKRLCLVQALVYARHGRELMGQPVRFGREIPLYVNPVNMLNTLTKVLAEGKGGIVRDRLKAERSGRLAAGESE
jgi:hypothetical protein